MQKEASQTTYRVLNKDPAAYMEHMPQNAIRLLSDPKNVTLF